MRISDVAALVTGGASGLGEATVRMLAAAGARVAILDRNRERGQGLAADVGGLFVQTDVTDEEGVTQAVATAEAAQGPARILVNCAGMGATAKTVSKGEPLPLSEFRRMVEVNLVGTFNVASKVAARMSVAEPIDGERGVIVNTASLVAYDGQVGQAAYGAAKAGVVGMTLPMARDLARHAIRVLTIAPGLFETPLFDGLPDGTWASFGEIPFPPRLGQPSEFAHMARALIENPMMNGETVRLDAALRLPYLAPRTA
jgi:NAD(P)-dependent dehydrogenase (short-subunit alcohol dehydrogenase family)